MPYLYTGDQNRGGLAPSFIMMGQTGFKPLTSLTANCGKYYHEEDDQISQGTVRGNTRRQWLYSGSGRLLWGSTIFSESSRRQWSSQERSWELDGRFQGDNSRIHGKLSYAETDHTADFAHQGQCSYCANENHTGNSHLCFLDPYWMLTMCQTDKQSKQSKGTYSYEVNFQDK